MLAIYADKAHEPKDVRGGAIPALQHLGREITLVALTLEGALLLCAKGIFSDRPWPERRHAEVTNLKSALGGNEDVRRLEVEVDDAGVVNELQALQKLIRWKIICEMAR